MRRTIIGIVLATDMVDHSRLTKVACASCSGCASLCQLPYLSVATPWQGLYGKPPRQMPWQS